MQQIQPVYASVNIPVMVATLSLCGLLVVSQPYLTIPLTPLVSQVFDVSQATAAWTTSAFGFAYALGFLIFGPLADRYSCKVILVSGLTALALITIAVGASSSFEILVQLRVVQGFIAATYAPAALAYINEVLPGPSRAVSIACVSTGFLLAGILGQVYSSIVTWAYQWTWVFWFLAITYVIAAATVTTVLPNNVRQKSSVSFLLVYQNMVKLLKFQSLLAVYAAALIVLLSFVAMYSGLGPHLNNVYGFTQDNLLLIRMAGIPGMLLSPLASNFIQKWGAKRILVSGLALAALSIGLEAISNQMSFLVIASGVFVAAISATVPTLIFLVSSIGVEAKAAAISLYTFLLFVGASMGSLISSLLQPIGFSGLCILLAIFLLIAAAIVQACVKQLPDFSLKIAHIHETTNESNDLLPLIGIPFVKLFNYYELLSALHVNFQSDNVTTNCETSVTTHCDDESG
jgi:MFS transporter, YNFM family, putative membrane transport protein